MIYLTDKGDKLKILVLEPGNVERIMAGEPAVSPDQSVIVAYTPDPVWLAEQLIRVDAGDAKAIGRLIDEAAKRPPGPASRAYHETQVHRYEPAPAGGVA